MSNFKKYKLNPETLVYEIEKVSMKSRVAGTCILLGISLILSFVYMWLFTSVLGFELPKTTWLRMNNAKWTSKVEILDRKLEVYNTALEGLAMRDDEIYRNIFGMNDISDNVRNAGFGGVSRYDYLEGLGNGSLLKKTEMRLDVLTKKTYVQSKSYDEVESFSKRAGDMASCIPAVSPIYPDPARFRISSSFGYRSDPITGVAKMHTGFDFACKPGNPVYATGDGVVSEVRFDLFGYGNAVTIDHGFGYKTRYAHLKIAYVAEGMEVKRGEMIAETGNSGRSTGPHLHYEVMYKGKFVNPTNYFDVQMPLDEYSSMVRKSAEMSKNVIGWNMHKKS